ncbi:NAD(+) diphosphatase [Luteimonas deserti]|uniref:NAD(+) diphosphatase n=1 Tax=Luteimonas deserti TaxID=2752306 RepID=A0A7Z0U048_9GAMM|nr:NAD(+) diphosphatase [Luteimonas deserti]NYZ62918.1 NAD(+) diphosphatase [Luteimonas deserti]
MDFSFVDAPLDRAEHLRTDSAALARLWPEARVLLLDARGDAAVDAHGGPPALTGTAVGQRPSSAVFLGLHGEQGWFALPAADAPPAVPAQGFVDLRSAAAQWPAREATAFAQARAVLHWRDRQRYCGACAAPLAWARAGWLGRCTGCGIEHYPRTDPAVIVAVSDGSRLLLGRQGAWPARRYSTLAGFVEPGETLEQTVMREVFEESGVRVRSCRYLASQPWPFPSSLMLGFVAEAEPDVPRVNDELEDARWFEAEAIGLALDDGHPDLQLSPVSSISRWLIARWYAMRSSAG